MNGFNKVMLMGHLTRDPQAKYLPNQSAITEFGLACNRHYKNQQGEEKEETLFVDCTAFGRQAEVIHKFCQKGKPLFVEGRLKHDTWTDKTTGAKRSKISVVVETFQFLTGPADSSVKPAMVSDNAAKVTTEAPALAYAEADIPF
jgi:single-strand DNA-binding protein